jgi:hypothetical protein
MSSLKVLLAGKLCLGTLTGLQDRFQEVDLC